jgi:pimeloyl-ACP methyl ester carboxylesterase
MTEGNEICNSKHKGKIKKNILPANQKMMVQSYVINGVRQFVAISDTNSINEKPVLLFLHGGPGSANMSLLHSQCPQIEENAIVVSWDQRGAGKSFNLFAPSRFLTVAQMVSDAHELTQLIKKQFHVEKIFLIGFSWGTALGLLLCTQHPKDYNCFISIGQMVSGIVGEKISLSYVKNEAHRRNDVSAAKILDRIQYDFNDPIKLFKQTMIQRKYLLKYGGIYSTKTSYSHEISSIWNSHEYSIIDFIFWPLGSARSLKTMWSEVVQLDFFKLSPKINTRLEFLSGKNDMNNPSSLVEEYFKFVEAPAGKKFTVFENSSHSIFWDEPKALEEYVVSVLKSLL